MGLAFFNSDLAICKNFNISERQKVQFRFSAFNWLNHPLRQFATAGNSDTQLNFRNPDGSLSQTNTNNVTSGLPEFTVGAPGGGMDHQVQFPSST